ncbi:RNA polymerase sigma factor [Candidatus Uabimicrobium sp. HlEnr_7]|uniref:RNA polymerase sigma factor n=1 Tax=Candidatus Uabimicrobium helgolandensis TaxID=3095367 RepID=UPI00355651C1
MSWQIFFELETKEQKSQCFAFLHKKILYNFSKKKMSPETAEDLTQDVCVKVMQNIEKILSKCQNVDHFKNYIYKLAKNILLDYIDKEKKHLNSEVLEEISIETPDGIILEKELRQILYSCMGKVNENWCDILIWKEVDGKSANEILLLSGVSERTQRLWRAKTKEQLKTCIESNLQNE